jgi:Asp-tRNA(Asn)/Glu-tRNA(Gln) amidotransferase A subunit family amidase
MDLPDTLDFFVSHWGPEYLHYGAELQAAGESWPLIDDMMNRARSCSADRFNSAARELKTQLYDEFMRVLGAHDLLIAPTTPVPPFLHAGDKGGVDVVDGQRVRHPGLYFHRLTEPPTHAGLPAVSIPAGFTPTMLPVGMQIVTKRFEDAFALRVATAFEVVNPWAQHRPLV